MNSRYRSLYYQYKMNELAVKHYSRVIETWLLRRMFMMHEIIKQADGSYLFNSKVPFICQQGGRLEEWSLAFETYGQLNTNKDNVILIHHALSTSSHVASRPENPAKGWWEVMVGPGKPVDTDQFFVICINNLGSCFGSSGPNSINPKTQRPYQMDFPKITMSDIASSQYELLKALGIHSVYAVIGNSMGGMISLQWAVLFPQQAKKLISVSSCYRAYPVSIAYHIIAKEIIQLDPAWKGGRYENSPQEGLKIARKVGLVSYRHADDLNQRFIKEGNIAEYLEYNATKLSNHFDANSYLYLLDAMDEFDVTRGYDNKLAPFESITSECLIISVATDVLFPPVQQIELYEYLDKAKVRSHFLSLNSSYGHDAFYADAQLADHLRQFLQN